MARLVGVLLVLASLVACTMVYALTADQVTTVNWFEIGVVALCAAWLIYEARR